MIADRRLHLTRAGQVVEEGDPEAFELLVAEGGTLPDARARELGITPLDPQAEEGSKAGGDPDEAAALRRAPSGRPAQPPKPDEAHPKPSQAKSTK